MSTTPAAVGRSLVVDEDSPDAEAANGFSPERVRDVLRQLQCRRCGRLLRHPVTLPCGRTLCQRCLPATHRRTNISYPGTESRLAGFTCPFSECEKDHVVGDCALDVTLNKTLTAVYQALDDACGSGLARHHSGGGAGGGGGTSTLTKPRPGSPVEVAAGSSSGKAAHVDEYDAALSFWLPASSFLAMYQLAGLGQLGYQDMAEFHPDVAGQFRPGADAAVLGRVAARARQEMDCQVCYALFYDPLTTPCGHTFCRHCLCRVLDYASSCPVCRRQLSIRGVADARAYPANELLGSITRTFWPDTLELRQKAVLDEGRSKDGRVPIFVCTLSFPSMPTFLHVFEGRYRLMIRRALDGDRTFGMVLPKQSRTPSAGDGGGGSGDLLELGTLLRIIRVEFLPDGRSLLETIGLSRFRLLNQSMLDGYVVAEMDPINDISIAEEEELEARETQRVRGEQDLAAPVHCDDDGADDGAAAATATPGPEPDDGHRPATQPSSRSDLDAMFTRELMDFSKAFVDRMNSRSVDWLARRILDIYGERPDDPAIFPWWFASILPVTDAEKYRLLATTSVRERLKICCGWILDWRSRRW